MSDAIVHETKAMSNGTHGREATTDGDNKAIDGEVAKTSKQQAEAQIRSILKEVPSVSSGLFEPKIFAMPDQKENKAGSIAVQLFELAHVVKLANDRYTRGQRLLLTDLDQTIFTDGLSTMEQPREYEDESYQYARYIKIEDMKDAKGRNLGIENVFDLFDLASAAFPCLDKHFLVGELWPEVFRVMHENGFTIQYLTNGDISEGNKTELLKSSKLEFAQDGKYVDAPLPLDGGDLPLDITPELETLHAPAPGGWAPRNLDVFTFTSSVAQKNDKFAALATHFVDGRIESDYISDEKFRAQPVTAITGDLPEVDLATVIVQKDIKHRDNGKAKQVLEILKSNRNIRQLVFVDNERGNLAAVYYWASRTYPDVNVICVWYRYDHLRFRQQVPRIMDVALPFLPAVDV